VVAAAARSEGGPWSPAVYRGKNVAGFLVRANGDWHVGRDDGGRAWWRTCWRAINFGLGPTIAVKKAAVASIGGYEALGEYFANDYMIGKLIDKAGYRVVLSHQRPSITFVSQTSFQKMWGSPATLGQVHRAYSRPKGHFGSGF